MRTTFGDQAGFTLVEVMIAVLLLAVGILGTAQVFVVADRHTAYAREETVAVSLAQEIREKIMSESWNDVESIFDGVDTDVPGTVTAPASEWADHVVERLGVAGRGTIRVDTPEEDAELSQGMLGVTVTMSWNERGRAVALPLRFDIAKTVP